MYSETLPGNIEPVRNGVYLRDFHGEWVFSLFENGRWFCSHRTLERAASENEYSVYRELDWRGLTRTAYLKRGGK